MTRIIILTREGEDPKYYTSITKMCNINGFNYKSIAEKKGYPKKYKGWLISRVELNL